MVEQSPINVLNSHQTLKRVPSFEQEVPAPKISRATSYSFLVQINKEGKQKKSILKDGQGLCITGNSNYIGVVDNGNGIILFDANLESKEVLFQNLIHNANDMSTLKDSYFVSCTSSNIIHIFKKQEHNQITVSDIRVTLPIVTIINIPVLYILCQKNIFCTFLHSTNTLIPMHSAGDDTVFSDFMLYNNEYLIVLTTSGKLTRLSLVDNSTIEITQSSNIKLGNPQGITIFEKDTIIVSDSTNQQIIFFKLENNATRATVIKTINLDGIPNKLKVLNETIYCTANSNTLPQLRLKDNFLP